MYGSAANPEQSLAGEAGTSTGSDAPSRSPRDPGAAKKKLSGSVQNMDAARRVDAYMKSNGLTQVEFCARAGTSDKTLRRFLKTGELRRRSVLQTIASAMDTTVDKLTSPSG